MDEGRPWCNAPVYVMSIAGVVGHCHGNRRAAKPGRLLDIIIHYSVFVIHDSLLIISILNAAAFVSLSLPLLWGRH